MEIDEAKSLSSYGIKAGRFYERMVIMRLLKFINISAKNIRVTIIGLRLKTICDFRWVLKDDKE